MSESDMKSLIGLKFSTEAHSSDVNVSDKDNE
jgi:hypothetical protein